MVLISNHIAHLYNGLQLARKTFAIIKQNLAISLGVIAILITTSLIGVMDLPGAVIFHEGSTIVVVLNALRLLRYNV
jgi:Cd2+/Zn2+-exporting ATPase